MKTNKEVKDFKPSAFSFFNQEKFKESWTVISEKEDLNWTVDFIENNRDNLDWKALSFNDSLPWSVAFIKRFETHWDWHALSYIIADKMYFDSSDFNVLLKRYKEMLDWKVICQGTNLNHHHLSEYSESIKWDSLSSNSRFKWSESFVNEFTDKINWKIFTECLATAETSSVVQTAFRKKVLHLYDHKLDFSILSENDRLDFTLEMNNPSRKRTGYRGIVSIRRKWRGIYPKEIKNYELTISIKNL